MKNYYTFTLLGNKKIKKVFLFLFLYLLITACAETVEPDEIVVIDPAYLTSNTYPLVSYPLEIEDEFEIKIGELFGYEDVNWDSYFPWEYTITSPEIIEGDGEVCTRAEDGFSVLAVSLGSCPVKYPSTNAESEGFIFLTIKVVEG